jgi:hypothetical protein
MAETESLAPHGGQRICFRHFFCSCSRNIAPAKNADFVQIARRIE